MLHGDPAGDALRARLGLSYSQVTAAGERTLLDYVANVTGEKLDDIQNSIGLTINRMASANFLAPQIQDFESTLKGLATSRLGPAITTSLFSDEATAKYSVGMIAPSDIVDLINQMSGSTKIESLDDIAQKIASTRGISIDDARNSIEYKRSLAAYESIAKFTKADGTVTAANLHQQSITPSAVARTSLEQQGRNLGRQRAMGIALGVSAEDLPGFDPLILEAGGRLGVKDDILSLRNSMVEEYKGVITELRAKGLSEDELAPVQSEMETLKTADLDTIRRILSMSEKRIKQYGSISAARRLGRAGMSELEALTPRSPTSTISEYRALSDPRYAEESRSFLRSEKMRKLFEEVKKLEDEVVTKGKPERLLRVQAAQAKAELGEELSKGLRVIEQIHRGSGANVLDIIETLEAEMQGLYGARADRYLEYVGHEGEEDLMMQLHNLSKRRRDLRLSRFDPRGREIVSGHYETFKSIVRVDREAMDALGGSISDDLMDISASEATKILELNEERIKNRR